jgi:hypothetical protein
MRAHAISVFAVVVCGAWSSALAAPRKLYLNFSDGSEAVIKGDEDDARRNVSRLCAASPFLPWLGAEGCGDRDTCKAQIAQLVQEQWRDFDVEVTVQRPAAPDYGMVMIGPSSGSCQFGLQGIAHIDCANRVESNVAFAFDCAGSVSVCAAVISHELAHGFGLGHSQDRTDIMYGGVIEGQAATFRDTSALLSEPVCGATSQSSRAQLLAELGAWPAGQARARDWLEDAPNKSARGGCQLSPGRRVPWLAGLTSCIACVTRRRRRSASASTRSAHSAALSESSSKRL